MGHERRAVESIAVDIGGVDEEDKGGVDAIIQRIIQVGDQEETPLGGLTLERDREGASEKERLLSSPTNNELRVVGSVHTAAGWQQCCSQA